MTEASAFSPVEMLACLAARQMKGRSTVFIGTGIPLLAAALAKRLYAPELLPVFDSGGIGSTLEQLPLGVGEARTFDRAFAAMGICEVMETAQRGLVHDGFLVGSQVDPFGNLNSTVIGSHEMPTVRLAGSGGGNDLGSLCWRTTIVMRHEKKRFVERLDFITTPGYLAGRGARERAGLPKGTGPYRVLTDLATFDFETKDRRMRLIGLNPGVTLEAVRRATGFPFRVAGRLSRSGPPTPRELHTLRAQVDPHKIFLK